MTDRKIKLTTAHYYTPSGRCIQKPYGAGNKEYREDYKERLESGELFGKDTFKYADSLLYHTKNGRDVYGGGGIMPDVFVPIDTSMNSPLLNILIRKGVVNKFGLDYVDKNRASLGNTYALGDDFYNKFEINEPLLADFFAAAVVDSAIKLKDGTRPVILQDYFKDVKNDSTDNFEQQYHKSEKLLKALLKANIGRNLFDVGMYYRVVNATVNNIYGKALEVMNSNKFDVLKPAKPGKNEKGRARHQRK